MDRSYSERREALFTEALERPAGERRDFLARSCSDDPLLLEDLEGLLRAHDESEGFLDGLADRIAQTAPVELEAAARPRVRLGAYALDGAIGHGGMGVVYRASRVDGEFEQQVALKLLHLDMNTPRIQARFLAERQLLARFEHPNIARLLDGGVTDEGRPYFVMEYVDGQPITEYCRAQRLSLEGSLRLFLDVIGAVSYLHRNLVVHRDLKPSNIYVRRDGVVKILDFGIAKLLGEEGEAVARTVTGERLLTPQYAAPEQLLDHPVTTATDVYGLGAVLYELVSGRPVRDQRMLDLAAIRNETTVPPSAALARVGAEEGPDSEPPGWSRVPRDLDNICLMALRPEAERRYGSAELLGNDLERLLEGRPVTASPDTLGYRAGKFVQRNYKAVVVSLALAASLAMGVVRERSLRNQAQLEASRAQAVSDFLGELFSSADPVNARGRSVTVEEVLARAEANLAGNEQFAAQPKVEAAIRLVLGKTFLALGEMAAGGEQLQKALDLAGGLEGGDPTAHEAAAHLGNRSLLDEDTREELLRRVIEIREATLPSGDAKTLEVKGYLTRALRERRRYDEAESVAREVLAQRVTTLGAEHPDTLRAMNSLGGVLFETARFDEAAQVYGQALEIARRRLGSDHPDALRLASNLGACYSTMGRYLDAEPLQRGVVEARVKILGGEHHQTGISMHNLGNLHMRLGRYEEAEAWFRRAVAARAELGGAGYTYSKSFLADALRELGRWSEAEALYAETLEEQREQQPDSPDVFRTSTGLATLSFLQGDLRTAEELASKALANQIEITGDKTLDAVDTLALLARIRLAQSRFDEADEFARRALEISSKVLGPEHPDLLLRRLARARVHHAAGNRESARAELDGLEERLSTVLGEDHPATVEAQVLSFEDAAD